MKDVNKKDTHIFGISDNKQDIIYKTIHGVGEGVNDYQSAKWIFEVVERYYKKCSITNPGLFKRFSILAETFEHFKKNVGLLRGLHINNDPKNFYKRYKSGKPTAIPAGWSNHSITIILWKNQIIIGNRGDGGDGIEIYNLKRPITANDIKKILSNKLKGIDDATDLIRSLYGTKVARIKRTIQQWETCGWTNKKAAIEGLLVLMHHIEDNKLDNSGEIRSIHSDKLNEYRKDYNNFSKYIREYAVREKIEEILTAKDKRKADKAMFVLAKFFNEHLLRDFKTEQILGFMKIAHTYFKKFDIEEKFKKILNDVATTDYHLNKSPKERKNISNVVLTNKVYADIVDGKTIEEMIPYLVTNRIISKNPNLLFDKNNNFVKNFKNVEYYKILNDLVRNIQSDPPIEKLKKLNIFFKRIKKMSDFEENKHNLDIILEKHVKNNPNIYVMKALIDNNLKKQDDVINSFFESKHKDFYKKNKNFLEQAEKFGLAEPLKLVNSDNPDKKLTNKKTLLTMFKNSNSQKKLTPPSLKKKKPTPPSLKK